MILIVDPGIDWGWVVKLVNPQTGLPTRRYGPYATIQEAFNRGREELAARGLQETFVEDGVHGEKRDDDAV